MNLGLIDKTAIISAGSKGLGKASALALAGEGCNIAICSRNIETLKAATNEITAKFDVQVYYESVDINSNEQINSFVKNVSNKFGGIDILVNNCGGPPAGIFTDFEKDDWDFAYQQILISVITFTKAVIPFMESKKWGRIINLTSVSALQPVDNLILSTTFRTGLIGFSKTLSTRYAEHGITVNSIAPGYILTERLIELAGKNAARFNKTIEEAIDDLAAGSPMKKTGQPEDIGNAVAFLASDLAGYITGNTIHVDGGIVKGIF